MPITASENPVSVYGANAIGSTRITWSTNAAGTLGRVFLIATENGVTAPPTVFDGPEAGAAAGSNTLNVRMGGSYLLQVRRLSNNAVMASLTVTVVDLKEFGLVDAAKGAALIDTLFPPQAIFGLKVRAGIDTCRVSFKTTQPTIPFIQATDADGTNVGSAAPLFSGPRTQHDITLGETNALPQSNPLSLKILAPGHNLKGQHVDVEVLTQFTTGARFATIDFTEIDVHRDGDPGTAGDFDWNFGAGDGDTGAELGHPWPSFDRDISDDDPPVPIQEKISVDLAPRTLGVSALGVDDDGSFFEPGFTVTGFPKTLTRNDTGHESDDGNIEFSWVTQVFDIAELSDGTLIPMTLTTGNFGVAFTIRGQIAIRTVAGVSPRFPGFDFWESPKLVGSLPKAGFTKRMSGKLWTRSADGAVYRQDGRGSDEGWKAATPPINGVVTMVDAGGQRTVLFALDGEGAVVRADLDASETSSDWRFLDGRFTRTVAAAIRGKTIELVARDEEGTVFHRSVGVDSTNEDGWRPVGGGAATDPLVLMLADEVFAVFVLGTRGEVLMRRHRDGRWLSDGWQVIDGVRGERLGASAIDAMGLTLAVVGEDGSFWTQSVHDARDLNAEGWEAQGDFQAWLTRTLVPRGTAACAEKATPMAAE